MKLTTTDIMQMLRLFSIADLREVIERYEREHPLLFESLANYVQEKHKQIQTKANKTSSVDRA